MLQLSLCVLTVIQMTSADVMPDFIQQPYAASEELIKPVNPPLLPVGALKNCDCTIDQKLAVAAA